MKLFYKPGACSMASHIVLNEIGQDFELDKTNTEKGTTESGQRFRDISPNGYVPALEISGGEVITENPAVLQYLADLAPDSELAPPSGTLARTRLQELLNFISSEMHRAYSPFFSGIQLDETSKQRAQRDIARCIDFIQSQLSDVDHYLLGNQFTVADAYAFVVLNWSGFINYDLSPWPLVQSYMQRISERPSVIKSMVSEGLIQQERAAS